MDIPLKYKQLWSKWDIRVLILLSLLIQIILIFLGRFRRNFSSRWIRMILWGSYLLADWVAIFVLGQLSSSMDNSSSSNIIIAFWAPFLILHLGGPDAITAYSIEDNELWGRHLIGLNYELIVALYVLFRSLPNTRLLAPTLLIFLVAIIKYAERSYSLYRASVKGFRNSIVLSKLSSYNELQEQGLNIWTQAFHLYSVRKASFVDAIQCSENNVDEINNKLLDMSTDESLHMMKIELNFAYEEFYTKAIIIHSRHGYVLRIFCSICILVAFLLFLLVPKNDFENIDVAITYILLIGAICLDIVATIMLVFSDWMVINLLSVKKLTSWSVLLAKWIIRIREACHERGYWSIKMPQINLFMNCIMISAPNKISRESIMNRVVKKLSLVREKLTWRGKVISREHEQKMEPIHVSKRFLEIITRSLPNHLHLAHRKVTAARAITVLEELIPKISENMTFHQFELSFDLQVLVWHIVTGLCCHLKSISSQEENASEGLQRKKGDFETCMYLSNYLMHIVLVRSDMVSVPCGARSSHLISETISALIDLFREVFALIKSISPNANVEEACIVIMNVKLTNSNRVLETVQRVARYILDMMEEERWSFLAEAWTELLVMGAMNSKANIHVKQLCRGDELLTYVWLFINNLQRGYSYELDL